MFRNRQKLGDRGQWGLPLEEAAEGRGLRALWGERKLLPHPSGGYMRTCKCEKPSSTHSRSAFLYIQVTPQSLKETRALGIQPHPQIDACPNLTLS